MRQVALTERRSEEAKRIRREYQKKYGRDFSPRRGKVVVPREDGLANCVTATQGIEQYLLEDTKVSERGDSVNTETKTHGTETKGDFKFVELCAGIGGVSFGFERVGGECVLAAEYDPQRKGKQQFAQEAYKALHPGVPIVGDVFDIKAEDVPDHDVMSFTTPCQSFSVAGKRGGFDDVRGTVYFECMRLASAKKPKVIFMENVKGLVGHDKGKTLDTIVKVANECGYRVDFNVVNSKFFGVPQNRERFFMIGVREDLIENEPWNNTKGSKVVPKGKRRIQGYEDVKTFNFDWPSQETVTNRLVDVLETKVDERYYLSDEKTEALVARLDVEDKEDAPNVVHNIYGGFKETKPRVFKDESPTIRTSAGGGHLPSLLEETGVDGLPIREATKKGYAVAEEGDSVNFRFPDSKTRRGRIGKQIANTLEVQLNQGVVEPCVNNKGEVRINEEGVSNAVDANYYKGLDNHAQRTHVLSEDEAKGCSTRTRSYAGQPEQLEVRNDDVGNAVTTVSKDSMALLKPKYRIRKLTPLECFRLQGFSDEVHEKLVESDISDSQRYKMAGNAVTVNVIEALGERLLPYV